MDWEGLLQQLESIPGFGDVARKLRYAWEIWQQTPASSQPVRKQATTLNELYTRASQLFNEFDQSLFTTGPYTLRDTWHGTVADAYLGGPLPTAFQVEHDIEPTNNGQGMHMWQTLTQTVALLDYNGGAHHDAADKLDKIRSAHDQLDSSIKTAGVALAATVALQFVPVADIAADVIGGADIVVDADDAFQAAEAVDAIIETEEAVDEVETVVEAGKTISTVKAILAAGGALITLIGVTIVLFMVTHHSSTSADCPPNPVDPLTPEQKQTLSDLEKLLGGKGWNIPESLLKRLIRQNPGKTAAELLQMIEGYANAVPGVPPGDVLGLVLNQGLSIEQMLRLQCLGLTPPSFDFTTQSGTSAHYPPQVRDAYNTFWNQLRDHMSPEDINGAWREYNGCPTAGDADHQQEIQGVQNSITNLLKQLNNAINYRNVDPGDKAFFQSLVNALNKLSKFLNDTVTGATQPGVINPNDFFQQLMQDPALQQLHPNCYS